MMLLKATEDLLTDDLWQQLSQLWEKKHLHTPSTDEVPKTFKSYLYPLNKEREIKYYKLVSTFKYHCANEAHWYIKQHTFASLN